jgi:hypothetical protein
VILHSLWFNYFWPSITGNGPESLVEILVGVVVWQKLLGPRVKKWHAAEMAKHRKAIGEQLDEHHDRVAETVRQIVATQP